MSRKPARKPGPRHKTPPGGLSDPNHCRLPMRGGLCPEHLLTQTNREGYTVLYCRVHGERPAPIIRPVSFTRHDQRDRLEAELKTKVTRAQAEALPAPHTPRKPHDLSVVGSALAWKLQGL